MKYSELKKMRYSVRMRVREVFKITEWKDDCVWKTKSLGLIVCNPDYKLLDSKDYQIYSASTKVTKELI